MSETPHSLTPQQDIKLAETMAYAAKPELDRAAEIRAAHPVEGALSTIIDGKEYVLGGTRNMDPLERHAQKAHQAYGEFHAESAQQDEIVLADPRLPMARRMAAHASLSRLVDTKRTAMPDSEARHLLSVK